MTCDVSWKSKLSTLNDENMLLKTQVEYVVQERENIKLEFQKLFNSIKATRTQHQKEVDELIKHVNQKTYAYADVRAQNQDIVMTISELKDKLRTIEKASMSKPVTSYPTPKNEQIQKQSANIIAKGMYRITKSDTQTPDSKTNIHVSNSTGVESSNSVRKPKSKGTKSKNRVLKNTKSSFSYVRKISRSVSINSNKCETKDSNVCQTNASVSNFKTVNAVNDGLNIICVSCGKDVFLLSHEKCVARYALSRNSNVKRALFTTPLVLWIVDSGCSKHMTGNLQLLRNFVEKFMGTVRFGNDHFAAIIGYGDYVQGNLMICHGDDLLAGSCDSNLYTVSIFEMAASSLVCLMSRATSTKSWLRHRRLSHLNFDTINQLMSKYLVDGILKFKYNKITYVQPVEQALEFLWAEHIATACFTQNCSIVLTRYNKTPYELIRGDENHIQYFHVFGSLYYPTNDRDDLGKMKPKADIGIFIGYSESSRGFHIYNRTKKIMEMIHVKFDELAYMASKCNNLEPIMNCMNFQDSSEDSQSIPSKSDLDNLFGPLYEEYYATSSQEVSDIRYKYS
ncbi:retrovirus-related pol polyprotein from transposon TNT 1-94 [Tanacetum coccineum]|uniref:Retrovirus-related pol polyprotein from transposon TNT 1-94 n=1 Tax=Tanacetum coccineum TaxID=301880 RepID=A0ABQ4WK12_9ASTR